jgi:hypothetical protein
MLRTADDKAGLSAKCPACGEIIYVPFSTEAEAPAADSAGGHPEAGIPLARDTSADAPDAHESAGASTESAEIPRRRTGAEVVCPGCQATNDATARNCRYCGTSLEGVQPVDRTEPPPIPPFDVSEIMNSAWKLYTQELGLMLGAAVIMTFLPLLLVLPCVIPVAVGVAAVQDEEAALLLVIPAIIVFIPILLAFTAAMSLGNTRLYLNIARGDGPSIGNIFWGFTAEGRPLILPTMLVLLAAGVLTLVGFLLCCAPGLLVSMCWWPALPLLVDRRLSGSDAIGQTVEYCKRDLGQILAVGAIAMGVQMVPSFIPYIGVILQLFAIPLAQLLIVIGYLRMTRQPTQFERWKQPAPTGPAAA